MHCMAGIRKTAVKKYENTIIMSVDLILALSRNTSPFPTASCQQLQPFS